MKNKRQHILESAIAVITRYGYRRTSMADIANEAGISRPAIYLQFKNKEEIAQAAIELVAQNGLDAAESAMADCTGVKVRLKAFLSAYTLFYYRLIFTGPHAHELLMIEKQLGEEKSRQYRLLVVKRINAILGLEDQDETGFILAGSCEGIKINAPDEKTLHSRISTLVDRFISNH